MKCADWSTPVEHEMLNMTSYISTLSLNRADFHFTKLSLKKNRKMYCTFKLYFIVWLSQIYLLNTLTYGIFYNITLQKRIRIFLNNYDESFCNQNLKGRHSINSIRLHIQTFYLYIKVFCTCVIIWCRKTVPNSLLSALFTRWNDTFLDYEISIQCSLPVRQIYGSSIIIFFS